MMSYSNRISQTLHEEHRATVALVERLENLIARHARGSLPNISDSGVAQLLSDLSTSVQSEVERHFDFEEAHLFPFLDAIGDGPIGAHLTDEHASMRPLGVRVATMAREAAAGGFDQAKWDLFRRLGQELCERMLAHIQKEEMALLPLIEENMDSDTEMRLYEEYAATA
jgi:hemerythrin-like domain-containing protein